MPEPSFLGEGTTQDRGDTAWKRWMKILGEYQNEVGALPANNPARGDTLRVIKQKVLCAVTGTSYTG